MFHFHNWTKWEKYYNSYAYVAGRIFPKEVQGKTLEGRDLRQRRECKKCGKIQDNIIEEMI